MATLFFQGIQPLRRSATEYISFCDSAAMFPSAMLPLPPRAPPPRPRVLTAAVSRYNPRPGGDKGNAQ